MKKSIIISTICASLMAMSMPIVSAEEVSTVTLRIEGINECFYYDEYSFDGTDDTLGKILSDIDLQNDNLSISGIDDDYITAINNDTAGTFGGWDGWLYTVNGLEPTVGINEYTVEDGDSILLYYGDPYGVGMQYPSADISEIENGVITFTSSDAVYDADYNVSYETNPVVGMTVSWKSDDEITNFVSDENGQIQIPSELLSDGNHSVSWLRTAENGLPTVLRSAPDYSIEVKISETVTTTSTETETETNSTTVASETKTTTNAVTSTINSNSTTATSSPQTGDSISFVAMAGLVSVLTVIMAKKKNN